MNTDTKNTKTEHTSSSPVEDDLIPQDNEARKAWFNEAWAERMRNGLE